ncbi:glycosyltransferase family 4 protein [Streptomyces sp. NPDC005283]|uniref:glycosyltransferase family 4 protein n=1 Tax=Streptomyces sp. NPDC005283 TaxID=3156871 RepID=UPI00345195D9
MTAARRIMIFSREYPPVIIGGTSTVARNLAVGLAQSGWDVCVITADPSAGEDVREDADGVTVLRVGTGTVYNATSGLSRDILRTHRRLHAAARHLAEEAGRPDILALPDLFCLPEASLLARELDVPLINILLQDFRAITPYDQGPHRVTNGVASDHPHLMDIERKSLFGSDLTVFISEALRESITEQYGAGSFRHEVVHLGVDPEEIAAVQRDRAWLERRRQLLASTPAGERTPLLVACGRLVPVKGFAQLIKALALLGPVEAPAGAAAVFPHLVLVGSGPEHEAIQRLATELGVAERLTILGGQPRAEVLGWMAAADVAVVPSLWESFCYVCAEMMALGRPVVASAVDSLKELLPDSSCGYPVPVGGLLGQRSLEPADLARALRAALGDGEHASARGAAGRARIAEHFTNERFVTRLSALAAELAREGVRS